MHDVREALADLYSALRGYLWHRLRWWCLAIRDATPHSRSRWVSRAEHEDATKRLAAEAARWQADFGNLSRHMASQATLRQTRDSLLNHPSVSALREEAFREGYRRGIAALAPEDAKAVRIGEKILKAVGKLESAIAKQVRENSWQWDEDGDMWPAMSDDLTEFRSRIRALISRLSPD